MKCTLYTVHATLTNINEMPTTPAAVGKYITSHVWTFSKHPLVFTDYRIAAQLYLKQSGAWS